MIEMEIRVRPAKICGKERGIGDETHFSISPEWNAAGRVAIRTPDGSSYVFSRAELEAALRACALVPKN